MDGELSRILKGGKMEKVVRLGMESGEWENGMPGYSMACFQRIDLDGTLGDGGSTG